jgi:hypothetical protein
METWRQCGVVNRGCVQEWTQLPPVGSDEEEKVIYKSYVSNSLTALLHECRHINSLQQGSSMETERAKDWIGQVARITLSLLIPYLSHAWLAADVLLPATFLEGCPNPNEEGTD